MFPWYFWAICTVIIWGFHYNFVNKSLQTVSPLFIFLLPVVPLLVLLPFYYQSLVNDFYKVLAATTNQQLLIGSTTITGTIGTLCLFQAIATSNNPTMAALVEITYPLLVALVAFFLFGEKQLNPSMFFGGMLILIGSTCIIYFNK